MSATGRRLGGAAVLRISGIFFSSRRRHTRCLSDWSSDVCSSDLQFNNLRRDPTKQLDVNMNKKFSIKEKAHIEVRVEAFNVTNRVTFGAPSTTPTAAAFGQIGSQANTPRRI